MNDAAFQFTEGKPFFPMVMSFLAATIGLGPLFDPSQPPPVPLKQVAWYVGRLQPTVGIDMAQVRQGCLAGVITADAAVKSLCGMLLNSAYAVAEPHNDRSPEFEFFRHVRNAVSHGNRFYFAAQEPRRAAAWSGLVIDRARMGKRNPLFGVECVGQTLSPADALALLRVIEDRLPWRQGA